MSMRQVGRLPHDPDARGRYLHKVELAQILESALPGKEVPLARYIKDFSPAAIGTAETKALLSVSKGETVLSVHAERIRVAAAGTTTTLSVGDGGSLVRFIPVTDTEGTVGAIVQPTASNLPYIYPADDTIDIDYALGGGGAGTDIPQWQVTIVIIPRAKGIAPGASGAGSGGAGGHT